jgi:uracil-DNA glycosylase family 4
MMLVGEGPGEEEVINLTPFSGAAGWELDKILDIAKIVRPACRITNVSLERPTNSNNTSTPNSGSPSVLSQNSDYWTGITVSNNR